MKGVLNFMPNECIATNKQTSKTKHTKNFLPKINKVFLSPILPILQNLKGRSVLDNFFEIFDEPKKGIKIEFTPLLDCNILPFLMGFKKHALEMWAHAYRKYLRDAARNPLLRMTLILPQSMCLPIC